METEKLTDLKNVSLDAGKTYFFLSFAIQISRTYGFYVSKGIAISSMTISMRIENEKKKN